LLTIVFAVVTTLTASRLLGIARGWLTLVVTGAFGWVLGSVAAGALDEWDYGGLIVSLNTILLSTLFTMVLLVTVDLFAPVGSLAQGPRAGLVTLPHPVRDVRHSMSSINRYIELVRIARKNGLGPKSLRRSPDGGVAMPAPGAAPAIRRTVEDAGGLFIKIGQLASTRDDLLPPELVEELASLRASVPPSPQSAMREIVEAELGRPVNEVFAEFDWHPIAAGSIAHAYVAVRSDGAPVVVKVQRPNLDEAFERDTRALMQAARLIQRRTAIGFALSPVQMATEFKRSLAEELDFTIEAANALALQQGTPGNAGVRIPQIDLTLSTSRVLVQERFFGTTVADGSVVVRSGLSPTHLARRLLQAYFHHIFDVGVFHADPHPGNILLLDDGSLGLIDMGSVGRLSPHQQNAALSILIGLAAGDVEAVRQAVEDIAEVRADIPSRHLERAIGSVMSRAAGPGSRPIVQTMQDVIAVLGDFGIRLDPEMTLLNRALVSLEGTLRTIDPSFKLVDEVMQIGVDRLSAPIRGESVRVAAMKELATQFPRFRRFPARVDSVLEQLTTGRLETRVSFLRNAGDVRIVTRLVNRVVLGLIAASLGVGSVLLLGVDAGPEVSDDVRLNQILGYLGLVGAGVLSLRVIAGVIREGLN
jgi:ubiquinone biosynthesis protein